jgi:hypothetical protein
MCGAMRGSRDADAVCLCCGTSSQHCLWTAAGASLAYLHNMLPGIIPTNSRVLFKSVLESEHPHVLSHLDLQCSLQLEDLFLGLL